MEDYGPDLMTLTDDDGKELEFEILDVIEDEDGTKYFALLPNFETEEEDDGSYYILREEEIDGEKQLCEIDDEELLNALATDFEEHFNSMYFDDDEEEK